VTFLLLFIAVCFFILVAGALWTERSAGPLREMNAGAKLMREKHYPDAEAHFRRLLTKRLPPGVEADTRRRLANTLDVLGKPQEAASEREQIEAIAARHPKDARAQQAWGDLLKRKHQYDAACEAYIHALAGTHHFNKPERATIMAKLVHANFDAGRPEETVRWATCSLASLPNPDIRRSMERMSGLGYSGLGEIEKAERHYQNALRLSEADGNPKEIAEDLGILANIHYLRGQFDEAIAACREARQVFDAPSRVSYTIEAECLRDLGRFDDARAVLTQKHLVAGLDQPLLEQRVQSAGALCAASIEIRADQPNTALVLIEQARKGFAAKQDVGDPWPPAPQKGDDKMLLWCDATRAIALAQRGDSNASRALHESVLNRLSGFLEDRNTVSGVYSSLGRAAFIRGDLAESQTLFRQCLDCLPYPVSRPSAYYWLGETYLRLAETDAAREAFRQAVAPGIDSLDARRAQARLNEMGG